MGLLEKAEANFVTTIGPGTRVLAAISGGVDSMVLLDLLHRLSARFAWRIEIAHFNHQLRGAASDADERFVHESAEKRGLPYHTEAADVAAFARERGLSLEMAARELRQRFLATTAATHGMPVVALAHHADDQIETFWLRLLRGNVGAGLAGMQPRRTSAFHPEVHLVRPLLGVPKSELIAYAQASGVSYREDLSNEETRFLRNRIRRELLPLLREFQPQIPEITLRTAEVLGAEKQFLFETARAWLALRQPPFRTLHLALQREVIRAQLLDLDVTPTLRQIEQLRLPGAAVVSLGPDARLETDEDGIIKMRDIRQPAFDVSEVSIDLLGTGEIRFASVAIHWETVSMRGPVTSGIENFDAEALGREVVLRHWRPGDRYVPIGAATPVKLQEVFTNLKVPREERHLRLVATTASGEIFWVEGLRIGESFKVRPASRRVLRWCWRRG